MTCVRCEELAGELAYLRSELGLRATADEIASLRAAFGLSVGQARVTLLLAKASGSVTKAQIEEAVPRRDEDLRCSTAPKVYICRIRHKLGQDTIANVWGAGYSLTPAGRAKIAAAMTPCAA